MRHPGSFVLAMLAACGGPSSSTLQPDGSEATDASADALVDAASADESPRQIAIDWPASAMWMPRALTRLPSGGYVIVGQTSNDGATTWDGFAAGVSSTGELLWVNRYGGVRSEALEDVTALPNGDVIAVGSASETSGTVGYLLRLGSNGEVIWSRKGDLANTSVRPWALTSVATTPDGAVIVAGRLLGTFDDDGQALLRVSAVGTLEWIAAIDFGSSAEPTDVAVLADGTILVGGTQGAYIQNLGSAPFGTLVAVEPDGTAVRWARAARRSNVGIKYSMITPALAGGAQWLLGDMTPTVPVVEIDHVAADGTITRGGRSTRLAKLVDTAAGPVAVGADYNAQNEYAARWSGLSSLSTERYDHRLALVGANQEIRGIDVVAEPGGGTTALFGRLDGFSRVWVVRAAPAGDVGICTTPATVHVDAVTDPIPVTTPATTLVRTTAASLVTVTESARPVTAGVVDATCAQ